jgi:hypothetical protein
MPRQRRLGGFTPHIKIVHLYCLQSKRGVQDLYSFLVQNERKFLLENRSHKVGPLGPTLDFRSGRETFASSGSRVLSIVLD